MAMKLYIGNLAFQTSDQELKQLFRQTGTVEAVAIITDRNTGLPRGFAFVSMATRKKVKQQLSNSMGRKSRVVL